MQRDGLGAGRHLEGGATRGPERDISTPGISLMKFIPFYRELG